MSLKPQPDMAGTLGEATRADIVEDARMQSQLSVLVGTSKGAFLLDGGPDRQGWEVRGPFCDGWVINHVIGDPKTGHLWAGGGSEFTGAGVWRSTDNGATWQVARFSSGQLDAYARADPGFAAMIGWTETPTPFDGEVTQVWSLALAGDQILAGTKPAGLFSSRDGGVTWERVTGLTDHPAAASWQPGGAGLVLHTIITDSQRPERIWVGISAAGIYASEDGGKSWEPRNRLSNVHACSSHGHPGGPQDGEVGLCVHNMVRAPGNEDVLYQQNHVGVWRSSDGGRSWDEINNGLPSEFGFPIAVHPRDASRIWTLPLNGDMAGRFPPDAACAVWRSSDSGASWQDLRDGLPQKGCFFTVLRQAMATDSRAKVGVYFGTNSGSVFGSLDEGDTWHEIARHLPTILGVEVVDHAAP